jgi:hypothetical protein
MSNGLIATIGALAPAELDRPFLIVGHTTDVAARARLHTDRKFRPAVGVFPTTLDAL